MPEQDFVAFNKIARLSRPAIITEKLDGTNAQVAIDLASDAQKAGHLEGPYIHTVGDYVIRAGSRNRWITPQDDNYGFARWVLNHAEELVTLGVGRHFGEWWGQGIQRNYGLSEKRFSLFNVSRWCLHGQTPKLTATADPRVVKTQEVLPPCVGLVPVLFQGEFNTTVAADVVEILRHNGSIAAPGFTRPEGIVVFHSANGALFKKTLENDQSPKSAVS